MTSLLQLLNSQRIPADKKEILQIWYSNVVKSLVNNDEIWNDKINEIKYDIRHNEQKSNDDCLTLFGVPTDKSLTLVLQKYPDDSPIYPSPLNNVAGSPKLSKEDIGNIIKYNREDFWIRINKDNHDLDGCEVYLIPMYEQKKTGRFYYTVEGMRESTIQIIVGFYLMLRVGYDYDPNRYSCCLQ
jgi:hypothetical protein